MVAMEQVLLITQDQIRSLQVEEAVVPGEILAPNMVGMEPW